MAREVRVLSLPLPDGATLREQPTYAALRDDGWQLLDAMLSPRPTNPRQVVIRMVRDVPDEHHTA